jgi:hypothetical protein
MKPWVGGIVELIEHNGIRDLGQQLLSAQHGIAHQDAFGQHHFGAQESQKGDTFHGHRVRHGQDDPVSADGRSEGDPDAGVATGGFDNRHAWPQDAPLLCVLDERDPEPILDARAGIAHLELRNHTSREARGEARQFYQGRATDRGSDVRRDHGEVLSVQWESTYA